jgi:adenine deaminase
MTTITGFFTDILKQITYPAELLISNGRIQSVTPVSSLPDNAPYILPGFIDAHVHIESSMLVPAQFARLAVVHGTVATVSDPHEIANVCGMDGVLFMIENGNTVPFKFYFGAPSCVPATVFETAGATISPKDIETLLARPDIKYLAEMMNFPGVLHKDPEVLQKIAAAHIAGKPVDGHAPGLRGEAAKNYIAAGISTDHECFTAEEASDKLQHGMKIIIREGSAAKNFDALIDLLHQYPEQIMFCSDDKHPDSLALGHINQLCARAVAKGVNVFHVLRAACINPVLHYKLDVGLLQPGHAADFVLVNNLQNFEVQQTYINGQLVANNGQSCITVPATNTTPLNNFNVSAITTAALAMHASPGQTTIPVIEALDGQLITNKLDLPATIMNDELVSNTQTDVLKMVVVNRYHAAPVAKAFIKNIGLKEGALASSVAHDSHNIVAVGVDDESLCRAINLVIEHRGGVSAINNKQQQIVPLPVAGLMSMKDGYEVAAAYTAIDAMAKTMGSTLTAPFMTLSFMALLVIPHLKLSDKGLFDGNNFSFVS